MNALRRDLVFSIDSIITAVGMTDEIAIMYIAVIVAVSAMMLAATDHKVRSAITTPAGIAVVTLGSLLNTAGALWMRHIIGRPR